MTALGTLTLLGNSGLLLPLALVLSLAQARLGNRRVGAALLGAVGSVAGIVALLKLLAYSCPGGSWLIAPSGHAAMATVTYGIAALLMSRTLPSAMAAAVLAATALLAAAVGWARVELGAHTPAEVLCGHLIGAVGVFAFALVPMEKQPGMPLCRSFLVGATVGIVFALGTGAEVEAWLRLAAGLLEPSSALCL